MRTPPRTTPAGYPVGYVAASRPAARPPRASPAARRRPPSSAGPVPGLPWLSPRVSLATGFSLTRDANGRAPVRTAGDSGAFHLPTAFSNSQRVELGTQLDLGRLGRGIFGDSSPISRALGALTSLDLGFNRDRTSTYSSLAAAPSLTYQLGLVGITALRSQRDVPGGVEAPLTDWKIIPEGVVAVDVE